MRLIVLAVFASGCSPVLSQGSLSAQNDASPSNRQPTDVLEGTQRCEAGDKMECHLLGTSFERGESLPSSIEPIAKDLRRAAYYHGKACNFGHLFSCFTLADFYMKGKGVVQDYSVASRLYSNVCDGGPDEAVKFGCTELGLLYVQGRGVRRSWVTGTMLLQRACTMGNEPGCKLHDLYAGTGHISTHSAPTGAMGFAFGHSRTDSKRDCTEIGGRWQILNGQETCTGHIDALDREATIFLGFQGDHLATIDAMYRVGSNEVMAEFNRIGGLIWETYGTPAVKTAEFPEECAEAIKCFASKSAALRMYWEFKGPSAIDFEASSHGQNVFLDLGYFSPDAINAAKIRGL
jgi:hypothetical protein